MSLSNADFCASFTQISSMQWWWSYLMDRINFLAVWLRKNTAVCLKNYLCIYFSYPLLDFLIKVRVFEKNGRLFATHFLKNPHFNKPDLLRLDWSDVNFCASSISRNILLSIFKNSTFDLRKTESYEFHFGMRMW